MNVPFINFKGIQTYHGNPSEHPYGKNGEHTHDIIWKDENIVDRPMREINDTELRENADIL